MYKFYKLIFVRMAKEYGNIPKSWIEGEENLQWNKEGFEKNVEIAEDWFVTLPEVTLSNPSEALKFLKKQERALVSKLRESNEYVVNEVKEMLEQIFNSRDGRKKIEWYWDGMYDTPNGHHYDSYEEFQKGRYIWEPLEFLSNYEWSLSTFMKRLDQKLKYRWDSWRFNPRIVKRWNLEWFTQDEMSKLPREEFIKRIEGVSLIEKFKEDIKKISQEPEDTEMYQLKSDYMEIIIEVCKDMWFVRD